MSKQAPLQDVLPRAGNSVLGSSPGGLYRCKPRGPDDYCYIFTSRGNEQHWHRLMEVIGREDLATDPRLQDGTARWNHKEEVDKAITDWTMQYTKEEVMGIIAKAKVPVKSSPLHGEHNEDIYGSWLALSPDEIKALKERDAI